MACGVPYGLSSWKFRPHSLLGTFPQGSKHRLWALPSKGSIPGAKNEKPATEPARKNASCAKRLYDGRIIGCRKLILGEIYDFLHAG